MEIENLAQILQASIAPCVLISGLGLLLLSMTNRFSRPVDRMRFLVKEERQAAKEEKPAIQEQIRIFYKRGHLLRRAIGLISVSIFFVSTIMLMFFSSYLFAIPHFVFLIKFAYMMSMLCLIGGLIYFLLDIRIALKSVEIEAKHFL